MESDVETININESVSMGAWSLSLILSLHSLRSSHASPLCSTLGTYLVSLHHRKVSLHGTLVFLDFSHQALVIDHFLTKFNRFSEVLSVLLADIVTAASDIIMTAPVGTEVMVSLTYNRGDFSHPETRTPAETGSPGTYQEAAW